MKIVLASCNRNKYKEMEKEFLPLGIELLFGGDFAHPREVEETGSSYAENALLKARAWAEAVNLPAIADDSGLEVDALDGRPGVHSARAVPGSDRDRTEWLLKNMESAENRNARFVSCLAAVFPGLPEPVVCQRTCEGRLASVPAGSSGFGYDPVFIPSGYDKTFAELGDDIKTKISHRALAIKGIAEMLIPVLEYYAVHAMENSRPGHEGHTA